MRKASNDLLFIFLSTPSGWRATVPVVTPDADSIRISIHALRVEGDTKEGQDMESFRISIHALRVEGDDLEDIERKDNQYFYPRPPGGGRLLAGVSIRYYHRQISIHALRVEGDSAFFPDFNQYFVFLSTPSGWRATRYSRGRQFWAIFLSTPSGWRATKLRKTVYQHDVFLSTPSGWRATCL